MSDEQQSQPDPEVLRRLWQSVHPEGEAEHADPGDLGQYAAVLRRGGDWAADCEFPLVGRHIASGCERCRADLEELLEFLAQA